jgi:hypothetical protein
MCPLTSARNGVVKLSLITPAFSEEATIGKLLDLVLASPTAAEAIVDEQVSSSGAFSPAFSDVGGTAGA